MVYLPVCRGLTNWGNNKQNFTMHDIEFLFDFQSNYCLNNILIMYKYIILFEI